MCAVTVVCNVCVCVVERGKSPRKCSAIQARCHHHHLQHLGLPAALFQESNFSFGLNMCVFYKMLEITLHSIESKTIVSNNLEQMVGFL